MATLYSILAGKFHRPGSLEGCSPWDHKESDTTKRAHTHTISKLWHLTLNKMLVTGFQKDKFVLY